MSPFPTPTMLLSFAGGSELLAGWRDAERRLMEKLQVIKQRLKARFVGVPRTE